MDGGTVWNVNLDSAIKECMKVVDDYSDIILDVAICGYSPQPEAEIEKNALKNWMAAKEIKDYY